jgi:hypothetical protein
MSRLFARGVLLALLCTFAASASAQVRAWLERDRIGLGETTTLNIETDQATLSSPDYSPLLADFEISGNTSSRQFEMVNGVGSVRVVFAVALRPRREGLVAIPKLTVGSQQTRPLTLTVTAPSTTPARAGDPVFIETEADAQTPYLQQAVGVTVRLFYEAPVSGQLEQPPPEGASLQRVGEDAQYVRDIGGRTYSVLERHYLLIPERSGTLVLPGARFEGRGADGFFDDLIGSGGRALRATAAPRFLNVLPAPANAPQPWLPLRALRLRYAATPQDARAGEAVSVTIEATADGATAAQMPELQLGAMPSSRAQVFADPPQSDEAFEDGRPQVRIVRKFSIVPSQPGTLRIGGPRMAWWDVRAGVARTASLPDLTVQVAPGVKQSDAGTSIAPLQGAPGAATRSGDAMIDVPGIRDGLRPWALAALVFAALWLVTLIWALQRRQPTGTPAASEASASPAAPVAPSDLKRVLAHGDLGDVAEALCAMATPPAVDLDSVKAQLDDAHQVAAVDALQRARWGDGDGVATRAMLREAFRSGPRWRQAQQLRKGDILPPLYPRD